MRLRLSGRSGNRVRLALASLALLGALFASLLASPLAIPAILVAAALLLWERATLSADLRALAALVQATAQPASPATADEETKLEVADGAWGELCHALNRLLQQRRAEQQRQLLLPSLPAASATRFAEQRPPPEGTACEVVVLALANSSALPDPVAAMRDAAYLALHQAQLHEALLARWAEGMVLIFGALGQQGSTQALRSAYQAAQALSATWTAATPAQRPRITLAGGRGRVVILPGLGLTVLGPPIEQAVALQGLSPRAALVCNEDAYLGLRRLGLIPPVETPQAGVVVTRLPAAEGRPTAYAVPL